MSSDKDLDGVKVKKGLPSFGPGANVVNDKAPVDTVSPSADAPVVRAVTDDQNRIVKGMPRISPISLSGDETKVIPFDSYQKKTQKAAANVSGAYKTETSFDANVGVEKDGFNASVGFSSKKSIEVKTEASGAIEREAVVDGLREKGVDLSKGVPLDVLAQVLDEMLKEKGQDPAKLEDEERKRLLEEVSQRVLIGLREEKGTEVRAGVSMGGGAPAAGAGSASPSAGGGNIANELIATGGAMVGGLASLAAGSAKVLGAAVGAAGRGLGSLVPGGSPAALPAARFEGISVLPTISDYRVKQVEKATDNYESALGKFWEVPSMKVLRGQIEERARTSGISVPDAMEKMKPGGDWADLHQKFVDEVGGTPDATKAKVALDHALKSYTRQLDHGSEELLSADMDNPAHRKAKDRVDATKKRMESLTEQTPIFGGETESHAQRLKAAIEAIVEKVKEILQAVGRKVFGAEAEHATP